MIRRYIDLFILIARKIWYRYYIKEWIEHRLVMETRKSSGVNLNIKYPLISVIIPTYNRATLLTTRAIPSVLKQTYQNFEILVVGDHCTDNTEKLMEKFSDKRIKFYNLPEKGHYPKKPIERWMTISVFPRNKALELSSGDWIAPLDDDDEFSEDHLEVLLKYALEHDYEMVYGLIEMEKKPREFVNVGSYPPECGKICHNSALYSSKLKFFKYDIHCYKYGEVSDWNLWRRMMGAGVKIGFINKVVGKHYIEKTELNRILV